MLTVAAIAAMVASASLPTLSDRALSDAQHAVLFARDPAHLGDEPHLRCEVDACGLTDQALVALDQAVWAEMTVREDARTSACLADLAAIVAADRALPLAA